MAFRQRVVASQERFLGNGQGLLVRLLGRFIEPKNGVFQAGIDMLRSRLVFAVLASNCAKFFCRFVVSPCLSLQTPLALDTKP